MNIITLKLRNPSNFSKLIKNLIELTKNESLQIGLINSNLNDHDVLIQNYLTIDLNDYGQFMNNIFEFKLIEGFSMEVQNRYEGQIGYFLQ